MRFAALFVVLLTATSARADRAPKDRGTAKFVLDGEVTAVETTRDGEHDTYVVSIRVRKVHKGEGVKPGDLFNVSCYRLTRPKPKSLASPGHGPPPDKGNVIKAFVSDHQTNGGLEGVYPDWFDLLGKDVPKKK
jgi:hypothetical protein